MPQIRIAVDNAKGGVGKTRTTLALGRALAAQGFLVTMFDFDPQGDLTDRALGTSRETRPRPCLVDVLEGTSDYSRAVYSTQWEGLGIMPSDDPLRVTDEKLGLDRFGAEKFKRLLRRARPIDDFLLYDCPPALGNLTLNAMIAADYILIVSQPESASIAGIESVVGQVGEIAANMDTAPDILGVLATMVQGRTVEHRAGLAALRSGSLPVIGEIPYYKGRTAEARLVSAYEPIANWIVRNKLEGQE